MFGMLDYRAHKLYAVLVTPFSLVLSFFAIFVLPVADYLIAINISSNRLLQILIAISASFLIGIPWYFIAKFMIAIPEAVFNFLIDVLPADGRTKEQAKLVVQSGERAITLLYFSKPAAEWSDEAIDRLVRQQSFAWLYSEKRRDRVYALKEYYVENPELAQTDYTAKRFLKKQGMEIKLAETILSNSIYRGWVISYVILLGLILFNPWGAANSV